MNVKDLVTKSCIFDYIYSTTAMAVGVIRNNISHLYLKAIICHGYGGLFWNVHPQRSSDCLFFCHLRRSGNWNKDGQHSNIIPKPSICSTNELSIPHSWV